MDIFELRLHARRQRLADRAIQRDRTWERGPVAIVRYAERPRVPTLHSRSTCASCGRAACGC